MLTEQEFVNAIQQHQNIIYKVCNLYMDSKADREDLFQEILLNAWIGIKNFKGQSKFSTWLYRVALNTALTFFKKGLKKHAIVFADNAFIPMDFQQQDNEQFAAMDKAISQLSDIDKALVMLYLDDHSHKEIADIMGISVNNVAVKMNRIKLKLRESTKKFLS